jgi:hypothetical protein
MPAKQTLHLTVDAQVAHVLDEYYRACVEKANREEQTVPSKSACINELLRRHLDSLRREAEKLKAA